MHIDGVEMEFIKQGRENSFTKAPGAVLEHNMGNGPYLGSYAMLTLMDYDYNDIIFGMY